MSLSTLWLACGKVHNSTDAGAEIDASGRFDASAASDAGPAALAISPMSYEFGPVAVSSTSSTATFTFSNSGAASATGCSAPATSGTNAGDFSIVTDNCGTDDLAGGDSCTVEVEVTPAASGIRTMTLSRECTTGGTASSTANGIAVNRPMYIFITSVSYDGNLGGLDGADSLCNDLGTNGSLSGPLNKTWKALLSKTTGGVVNARDRFTWTGPMFDLGGKMVTQDPSSWPWTDTGEGSTIGVNEDGGGPDDSYVWSGSTANGLTQGAGFDCNNWSDNTSSFNGWSGETAHYSSDTWIDSFQSGCGDTWYGLYCISQ